MTWSADHTERKDIQTARWHTAGAILLGLPRRGHISERSSRRFARNQLYHTEKSYQPPIMWSSCQHPLLSCLLPEAHRSNLQQVM